MTCPDCGKANFAWATRCDHCGASLERADAVGSPAGASETPTAPPPTSRTLMEPQEQGAIPVEHTAAGAIEDPPDPPTGRPIGGTIALIVLNVALFAAVMVNGGGWDPSPDELTRWGANNGPLTVNGEWWRLLTATALHANLLHLLLNAVALWYAGRIAEPLFGRTAFLVLYLLSGLGGSVASLWWQPFVTGVGASGAIFGVYGGIGAWLMVRHRSMPAQAGAPLAGGLVAIIGYNLLFGFFQQNVDIAAHVGGLAA